MSKPTDDSSAEGRYAYVEATGDWNQSVMGNAKQDKENNPQRFCAMPVAHDGRCK